MFLHCETIRNVWTWFRVKSNKNICKTFLQNVFCFAYNHRTGLHSLYGLNERHCDGDELMSPLAQARSSSAKWSQFPISRSIKSIIRPYACVFSRVAHVVAEYQSVKTEGETRRWKFWCFLDAGTLRTRQCNSLNRTLSVAYSFWIVIAKALFSNNRDDSATLYSTIFSLINHHHFAIEVELIFS